MQRKLHPLEGIVAVFALFFVLALSVGFAQAEEAFKQVKQDSRPDAKQEAARQVKAVFLRSSSAMVFDTSTGEVVIDKNANAVVPIASITKLMTAIVILDRGLDLEQRVVVSREDIDTRKGSTSRLRSGGSLKRSELLLLALMASENRAAAALGRTYPGGIEPFVAAMNAKAAMLGMHDSRFVDSTGLSPQNVSSARDLVKLVRAAHEYSVIRDFSTRDKASVRVSEKGRPLAFANTNGLVRAHRWDVELSKTGYISEAGRCLVMRVRLASKDLIVVLLDSWGRQSRIGDANRIKKWVETTAAVGRPS
jgi:D-alanyl-D-alanine endopeptidase (penicillin-binding protein 7)